MSRKTKPRRSASSRRISRAPRWHPDDVPRLDRPLPLVCGVCGAPGLYDVGTVVLDTSIATSPAPDGIREAVGFTGYFRCRKCDAGGPWKLSEVAATGIMAMALTYMSDEDDVPIVFGCAATFDGHLIRYATEGESYLKKLIDREPERAFLWVRLGNLYSHAGADELAEGAFERAIELDPADVEARGMLGRLLFETGRCLEGVPHWHAVLKHVRDARKVDMELRRGLVRQAIECLLRAHAESNGQIDLFPTMDRKELEHRNKKDEPAIVELREFDLGSEEGIDELCDLFLDRQRRRGWDLFRRRKRRTHDVSDDWSTEPVQRSTAPVGRNAKCPCGSGHKYKKCCGRSPGD